MSFLFLEATWAAYPSSSSCLKFRKAKWHFPDEYECHSEFTFHLSFPRFKLHLRSKVGAGSSVGDNLPPLPLNKTVVEVLADFLGYLLKCASSYIQDTHPNGPDLWKSVRSHIDFVLSHLNGWEGTEQSEMRRAAVLAGLVPDNASGHSRLSFVTEGEASLHFSVQNGLPDGAMKVSWLLRSK